MAGKICPRCSEYKGSEGWLYADTTKFTKVVYLVERLNKKDSTKFFGCPNFPKCKFSYQVERIRTPNIYFGFSDVDLQS